MAFGDIKYKKILDNLNEGIRFVDASGKNIYWNKGAEIITGYRGSEALGAHCGGSIGIHVGSDKTALCDACPVLKTISDGEVREDKVFIRHKEGYLVPVLSCISPLRDAEDRIIGALEIFSDISWDVSAVSRIEELKKMALIDPLTEVGNRRYAEMAVNAKLEELKRYGLSFGVLFADVDDFKSINDEYGHQIADDLLRIIAKSIGCCLRIFDTVSRWGGDEFIGLAINIHDTEQLHNLARRICSLIEQTGLSTGQQTVGATVSIGATIARSDDTVESLLARVDRHMYQSKTFGKNRIYVA